MIILCTCIALVVISILFLIGWFFNAIEVAQKEIDNENE
jgi:hypothetical protein